MPINDTGDIPDKDDVDPQTVTKAGVLTELLDRGETIVHLRDGRTVELHGYDTYFFDGRNPVVYTQDESDDEHWVFVNDIVDLEQH